MPRDVDKGLWGGHFRVLILSQGLNNLAITFSMFALLCVESEHR